jgi:hypothetical protein
MNQRRLSVVNCSSALLRTIHLGFWEEVLAQRLPYFYRTALKFHWRTLGRRVLLSDIQRMFVQSRNKEDFHDKIDLSFVGS